MNPLLEKIDKQIKTDVGPKKNAIQFCVHNFLKVSDFKIDIDGFGKLKLPLGQWDAKKLIKHIKSKYPTDKPKLSSFPKFHEIPFEKLNITVNENTFKNHFSKVSERLGLPKSSVFQTHLQKIVIYGPEPFSYHHQIRSRQDNAVLTMVLILPFIPVAGKFSARLNEKEYECDTYCADIFAIKTLTFYTDCMHGIKQDGNGFHVLLTYCCTLQATSPVLPCIMNFKFKCGLEDYFFNKMTPEEKRPIKLVYRLRHRYPEKGLQWGLLKGTDRLLGLAFLSVAMELRLIPTLCIIETEKISSSLIQEYWESYKQKHCIKRRVYSAANRSTQNILKKDDFEVQGDICNFSFINPQQFLIFCESVAEMDRLFDKLPIAKDEKSWSDKSVFNPADYRMYEIYKVAAIVLWMSS